MNHDDPLVRLRARLAAAYSEQRARRLRARLAEIDALIEQAANHPDLLTSIVQTFELKYLRIRTQWEELL